MREREYMKIYKGIPSRGGFSLWFYDSLILIRMYAVFVTNPKFLFILLSTYIYERETERKKIQYQMEKKPYNFAMYTWYRDNRES